jgi:tetratricopeptide (TPR) repeat protein
MEKSIHIIYKKSRLRALNTGLANQLFFWAIAVGISYRMLSSFIFPPDQTDDELGVVLSDMVCTMKQEERSQFLLHDGCRLLTCSTLLSHTHLQAPPTGAEVVFTVHLKSFSQGEEVWKLSEQERLEISKKHKVQGSELFKVGRFHAASIRYSKAVQYLAAVDPDTPLEVDKLEEHEKEIISIRTACLLNLAACQLKFDQFDHVVQNCSRVLEVDSASLKGRYRRAKALLAMKDYEASRKDLLKAKELDPANQAITDLLRTVDAQESAHRAKYKDALKTMFT